jgi:hypothetical protein
MPRQSTSKQKNGAVLAGINIRKQSDKSGIICQAEVQSWPKARHPLAVESRASLQVSLGLPN